MTDAARYRIIRILPSRCGEPWSRPGRPGPAEIVRDEPGHLSFILSGRKLSGGFALTRTGEERWILVKVRDAGARPGSDIVAERPESIRSGKTWQDLKNEQARDGET